ncbi:MAG: hypothetical protein ACTSQW_02370 [Promethearchaeota archaeon]
MSKYERYKKQSVEYIYPHKHCKKCDKMIEEGFTYCSECYTILQEKKKKKRYKLKKNKPKT